MKWECVGGSVLSRETSFQGMLREVKEEVGIALDIPHTQPIYSITRRSANGIRFSDILDVYRVVYDEEVSLCHATTNKVAQVKWMALPQIRALWESGEMVDSLGYFFTEIAGKDGSNQ